jgi:hypothetical protein
VRVESVSIDKNKYSNRIMNLHETLANFSSINIINVDETGLFFKLLPDKTFNDKFNINQTVN